MAFGLWNEDKEVLIHLDETGAMSNFPGIDPWEYEGLQEDHEKLVAENRRLRGILRELQRFVVERQKHHRLVQIGDSLWREITGGEKEGPGEKGAKD